MLRSLASQYRASAGGFLASASMQGSGTSEHGTNLVTQRRHGSGKDKFVTAEDASYLIQSDATITVGGFAAQGGPEEVLKAIEQRFKETGEPRNLTLIFGGGPGDWDTRGLNHLAHEGLLARTIGSHYGQLPLLGKLVQANAIEAYNLPLGAISRMIRCAAAGQPGHITQVGFGTLVDPAHGGGKINEMTKADLVLTIEIEGVKYLFYKALPIDVAVIRGSTADADGNITMERESLYADSMIQAMAARATRGSVIAQVEREGARGSLHPRQVRVPGTMVDGCVIAQPENHWMSYVTQMNFAATSEIRKPMGFQQNPPLDLRKIIARRAALELTPGQVINLGVGMPEGIAEVCNEESVLDQVELTTEAGVHGGVGLPGHDFGPAVNYDALIDMNQQFDFYSGGGLDAAFLGMAEVDVNGDVNVTRVGPKLTGPGGFIDITQSTKRITLLGTFTASGLRISVNEGKLVIEHEGKVKKFINKVKEVAFCGKRAIENKQIIHYITERCVFSLQRDGLHLIEVAPGIDVQKDILNQMEFKPIIAKNIDTMNQAVFGQGLMYLKRSNFIVTWPERFSVNKKTNTVYINLKDCHINSPLDIEECVKVLRVFFEQNTPGKAHVVVNYDNFECHPELQQEWQDFAAMIQKTYYLSVRRYTTRAFAQHHLRSAIQIDDAREYTLKDCQTFAKQHGLMASPDTIAVIFKKRLDERRETENDQELDSISSKGLQKLLSSIRKASTPLAKNVNKQEGFEPPQDYCSWPRASSSAGKTT